MQLKEPVLEEGEYVSSLACLCDSPHVAEGHFLCREYLCAPGFDVMGTAKDWLSENRHKSKLAIVAIINKENGDDDDGFSPINQQVLLSHSDNSEHYPVCIDK